jgi:hypothetical protein
MNKKPDFFIVGAPKCGTTAMDCYLAAHPDIYMARKEMHHFGEDLRFGPHFYRRDRTEYLKEFEAASSQVRLGESSVWYLFSETAAAELEAFNPDARVIIMLREPVEMIHSLYYTFRWDNNEVLTTFEEALAAENDRRKGRRLGRATYLAQGLVYGDVVRFAPQVERYFKIFGRDRVHVILYDDFKKDVSGEYRKTLEFLEVEASFAPQNFKTVNDNKYARFGAVRSLMSDPMLRSAVLSLRHLVPRFVFAAMQETDAAIRKFNSSVGNRPPLKPETRLQLARRFAPEVERLGALLGRDLTHWSAEPVVRSIPPPKTVRLPQAPARSIADARFTVGGIQGGAATNSR